MTGFFLLAMKNCFEVGYLLPKSLCLTVQLSAVKPEDRCFLMSSTHPCQLHVNHVNKGLWKTILTHDEDGNEQALSSSKANGFLAKHECYSCWSKCSHCLCVSSWCPQQSLKETTTQMYKVKKAQGKASL